MKYLNAKTILVALVILIALGLALVAALGRDEPTAPTVTPSATPTADPYAQDRAVLAELSKDFAVKFFTYQKPNAPAYFDSIRPYMTAEFFSENKRVTDRETYALSRANPIRSTAESSAVTEIGRDNAQATVTITTEEGGRTREQTLELLWVKRGERWSVNGIRVESTGDAEGSDG